jgi:hypothetical protein
LALFDLLAETYWGGFISGDVPSPVQVHSIDLGRGRILEDLLDDGSLFADVSVSSPGNARSPRRRRRPALTTPVGVE